MALTNLSEITASQKQELVASLATLVVGDAADECTAEAITAVVVASGNSIDASMAALFASVVGLAGGVEKFCAAPGSGGGGGASAAGDSGAAVVVEEEEEEEEAGPGDAVDMFGGGDDAGGDY
jgi:ribosomal protein L12E/L44/L45/RPP1/RPP2|eukprot:scaffold11600_cov256-Chaetoceros_neogracile.AAC.9